jgi:uncharacterized protein YciI
MKYIVLFEDAADADPDIRKTHMRAHLEFLERHAGAINAAGPLRDHAGQGRDGLWIVEAPDTDQVERLIREDPFWPTGLRASYAILQWIQVYCDGKRLIDPH